MVDQMLASSSVLTLNYYSNVNETNWNTYNLEGTNNLIHSRPSLWCCLVKHFRFFLVQLLNNVETLHLSPLNCQVIINGFDELVQSIEKQMNYSFWYSNQLSFHQDLCLSFELLTIDLLKWITIEQFLTIQDDEFHDIFIEDEDEEDDEDNLPYFINDLSTEPNFIEIRSQQYLLFFAFQNYLMEICQTSKRNVKFIL